MNDLEATRLIDRWWHEVWREGHLAVIDEIFSDPFLRHTSLGSRTTTTAEYRALLQEFQRTLHRPETTVDDRALADDRIWMRATSRGVNVETGALSQVTWLLVWRVDGERIVEQWVLAQVGMAWER